MFYVNKMFGWCIVVFVLCALAVPNLFAQSSAAHPFRNMLNILHGPPVGVLATPAYCGVPPPTVYGRSYWAGGSKEEVEGQGCKVTYTPNIEGILSPMSHGGQIGQFFFDEQLYQSLVEQQIKLLAYLTANLMDILNKHDIQMTMWELIVALEWRRDLKLYWQPYIDQAKTDRLLSLAHQVLSLTLFTPQDIETINRLGREGYANFPRLKQLKEACVFELAQPFGIHAAFAQQRLYERVFLKMGDAGEGCANERDLHRYKDRLDTSSSTGKNAECK